jgi:hypothetical protein
MNGTDGIDLNYSGQTLFHDTLFTTNPTLVGLEFNPALRDERPVYTPEP